MFVNKFILNTFKLLYVIIPFAPQFTGILDKILCIAGLLICILSVITFEHKHNNLTENILQQISDVKILGLIGL
jgi:hypothetical protein